MYNVLRKLVFIISVMMYIISVMMFMQNIPEINYQTYGPPLSESIFNDNCLFQSKSFGLTIHLHCLDERIQMNGHILLFGTVLCT